MVANNLVVVGFHLEYIFLFVVRKVPSNNAENVFLVVHGDYL
jgi:hypothetical protein